jgi:hypothetical protein
MTRVHRRPKQKRKVHTMKHQNTVIITVMSALAFALAPVTSAEQGLEGGPSVDPILAAAPPVITVHSTDNVTRGKTGSFVLVRGLGKIAEEDMRPFMLAGTYVNFKVSGTAIAGVDYVLFVSPARIGQSGYGVIQVKTLPDLRGSSSRQAYSVVVTLEPGPGYEVGAASSATMWIKP